MTALLAIDLDALARNQAVLRAAAPGAEVAPVVKSDGYGLGASTVARRLWREGARSFFVARLAEGEALRAGLGPDRTATIYVLDGLTAGSEARFTAAGLTPVLATLAQANAALEARLSSVVLHVDTGMNRQGLTATQAAGLARTALPVDLIMSHLGSASAPNDPRNAQQLARFGEVRSLFPNARASLAASAGIFLGGDYRFDMVRPGISLYGGGPLEQPDPRLSSVATLTASVLDVRQLKAGDRLGYGDAVTLRQPARIAIVSAGYSDGVIRQARAGGYAWFAGARRPLLFVNMDVAAIDLGDAEAQAGDSVELLGPDALLDDLATAAGTVAHEVLVRLSRRAERIVRGGD